MEDKKQPIIVKKIIQAAHGHHGGAWKVAYADFVTAMMAFFLLMWLLGGTSNLVREGISDYFRNPAGPQGPGGASTSMIKMGGAMEVPRSNLSKRQPSDEQKKSFEQKTNVDDKNAEEKQPQKKSLVSEEEKKSDQKRLDELLQALQQAIEKSQALRPFKDQLLLDVTSEGLRIQIVDKENRPMFDLSSAILKSYTRDILHEIGKIINAVPNRVSISGHTDATKFASSYIYVEYGSFEERRVYSNWELSADRANAARRELVVGGMHEEKIARVVGLASSVLFDKANPFNPINRRISIIVLNKETEAAIGLHADQAGVKPSDIPQRVNLGKIPP
ncbi:MAG: flagellar motor protein MotB [Gammaproteobacteria bacterium]|nr:flagellar motor protein MotB [Gammaproteobacteria bacterium]